MQKLDNVQLMTINGSKQHPKCDRLNQRADRVDRKIAVLREKRKKITDKQVRFCPVV